MEIKVKVNLDSFLDKKGIQSAAKTALKAAGKRYYEMIHETIDSGKSFTPRTGNLQQSITLRYSKDAAVISAHKEYAPFVEFGTRAHKILPKRRYALKIPTADGYIFRKSVNHPGSKPYPFMFADFDKRKEEAEKTFLKVFTELVNG